MIIDFLFIVHVTVLRVTLEVARGSLSADPIHSHAELRIFASDDVGARLASYDIGARMVQVY